MNNLVIYLFILVANIVAILLIYYSFDKNIEKTKKLAYTMISMGVMYILILIIYFFSSIGLDKEATKQARKMITFSFVPVNSIILLPFLIRSFNKSKNREITTEQLNRRAITMFIIGIVLIVGEFFYFRNIEKGIIEIADNMQNTNTINTNQEALEENSITNEVSNDTINNSMNEIAIDVTNEISNAMSNDIMSNSVSNVTNKISNAMTNEGI